MESKLDLAYSNYCQSNNPPMDKESFIQTLLNDDLFNSEWSMGCTEQMSDGERVLLWLETHPNYNRLIPISRKELDYEVPKRKIKNDGI